MNRISPGESVASVIERDIAVINDKRVQVSVVQAFEPIDASPCDNIGFKVLEKSVRQIWPKYYVVPALMIAGTDTKHYSHLTKNMYRFLPVVLGVCFHETIIINIIYFIIICACVYKQTITKGTRTFLFRTSMYMCTYILRKNTYKHLYILTASIYLFCSP